MRVLAILAVLPLVACGAVERDGDNRTAVTGAGTADTERSYQLAGFTGIALAGPDDIDVSVGPAFSVRAEGPAEVLDRLDIHTSGTTLSVGRRRVNGVWNTDDKGAKIHVTMPAIAAASLNGAGDLSIDRVPGGNFVGGIEGSGDLKLGEVAADALSLAILGSGDILVSGRAKSLKAKITGSGNIDGEGLRAGGADVLVAGSGNVDADVTGDATVRLLGSGDVSLGKGARCRTTKAGSGDVSCG